MKRAALMNTWLSMLLSLGTAGAATVSVSAGGDPLTNGRALQATLNAASPGDTILLQAGGTFAGGLELPVKSCPATSADDECWITIRTSALDELPAPGTRIHPSQSAALPKLISDSRPVLRTQPGAHHYRIVGLEMLPSNGTYLINLVLLGTGMERAVEDLPYKIVLDRCYLHGDPVSGTRRGIALNSRDTDVINSYIEGIKDVKYDSQAIAGWNTPGPIRILNNHLEAAGENVMFGGEDPAIPDLVPSDIWIKGNHFYKPLAWKESDQWRVKNLFELKNARRLLIEANVFENNWVAAQNGFAILFTPRNQDGSAPWSVVEDVWFRYNLVRGVASAMNLLGADDIYTSKQTRNILIEHNLFEDVGARWGGRGIIFQLLNGTDAVVIRHNTAPDATTAIFAEGSPNSGFVYENNLTLGGIMGTGTGPGGETLDLYFPAARVRQNVLIGGAAGQYAATSCDRIDCFPSSLEAVGFQDLSTRPGNWRLLSSSPYKGQATAPGDGGRELTDVGADADSVYAVTAGVVQ
jgi:hypothetical protein